MTELGAHLLGRKVSVPDQRDYKLSKYLSTDPLDAALQTLLLSRAAKATKDWAKIVTPVLKAVNYPFPDPAPKPDPAPTPTPTPPVPTGDVIWDNSIGALDQKNTGHCVGFGWAGGWGDTLPIADTFQNADGHAVYYEAKIIDGEPGSENGSSVRSGAKAMQNRGRLSAYAFAVSVDEVRAWVRSHGPVVFGTDWTEDMFNPDLNGFIVPTGAVAGGHCYACVGDLPSEDALLFQNSWGSTWAQGGRFKIKYADVASLLTGLDPKYPGEACAAVELP